MNKIVLIYDNTGDILGQRPEYYKKPIGVPFIIVEVPQNKYVVGVNVSGKEHLPIFQDREKTGIDLLKESIIEATLEADYRLSLLELGLNK